MGLDVGAHPLMGGGVSAWERVRQVGQDLWVSGAGASGRVCQVPSSWGLISLEGQSIGVKSVWCQEPRRRYPEREGYLG